MIVEEPLCANSNSSGSFARAASEPKIFVLMLCSPYGLHGLDRLVKYAKQAFALAFCHDVYGAPSNGLGSRKAARQDGKRKAYVLYSSYQET